MKDRNTDSRLVYSTESGKMCPTCKNPSAECRCKKGAATRIPGGDGKIRVARSTRGRKGKGVSLISGLDLEDPLLKKLAKELKQKCGTGGTVKDGVIEIQGDHRDVLVEHLNTLGYKAVKAGG